jgi:hypothetical protein
MVFDKIEGLTIPPISIDNEWFGLNLTSTNVSLPTSSRDFNRDFQVELIANGSEPVVRITSESIPLKLTSDWDLHFSILKGAGQIEADFDGIGFNMDL